MAGPKHLEIDCPGSSYNWQPSNHRCYKKVKRAILKAIDVAVVEKRPVLIHDNIAGLTVISVRPLLDSKAGTKTILSVKPMAPRHFARLWSEDKSR